jgi:hypothetical protein
MKTMLRPRSAQVATTCALLATILPVACNQSKPPTVPASPEAKAVTTKEVDVVFEGPWAFVPDPHDANTVIALAPKTKRHRDLVVQSSDKTLAPGIYSLSLPARTGPATGSVDPNILRAKIDPQSIQRVLDTKLARYAIRLPKPEAYVEATHYRSRAGSVYPPDPSTEKDYITSVSLRYSLATINGSSLAGSPDSGTFDPLLLPIENRQINFAIDPAKDRDPADKCHTHERESFRDLTTLLNVTLFVDFPNDPGECHARDAQNPHRIKAGNDTKPSGFLGHASLGGRTPHLATIVYFFGPLHDCHGPIIVSNDVASDVTTTP